MALNEDVKKESDEEILRDVEREMAKPRVAKSARRTVVVPRSENPINRNDRKAASLLLEAKLQACKSPELCPAEYWIAIRTLQ